MVATDTTVQRGNDIRLFAEKLRDLCVGTRIFEPALAQQAAICTVISLLLNQTDVGQRIGGGGNTLGRALITTSAGALVFTLSCAAVASVILRIQALIQRIQGA